MAYKNITNENTRIYVNMMTNGKVYAVPNFWKRRYKIPWTKYTITESDMRMKTATFSSPAYYDLTLGRFAVLISSKDHENFSGIIIWAEYDRETGLYNYQCQDWSRMYLRKFAMINGNVNCQTEYHNLRFYVTKGNLSVSKPHTVSDLNEFSYILSGLRPMDMYNQGYYKGNMVNFNPFSQAFPFILKDTTYIDAIRNTVFGSGAYIDLWFNECGILQIEPFSKYDWVNTGLRLTSNEIQKEKFKFDITNVITNVTVNGQGFNESTSYSSSTLLNNFDLSAIFGNISASINSNISAVKNTNTSSNSKEKQAKLIDNPYNTKKKYLLIDGDGGETASFLKSIRDEILKISNGWTIEVDTNIGPSAHSRNKGKVKNGCYMPVYNGLCAGTINEMPMSYYGGVIKNNGSVLCPAWDTRDWTSSTMKKYRKNLSGVGYLKRAWDDNFSPSSFQGIDNPSNFMNKNGIKYCVGDSASLIALQFLSGGAVAYNSSQKSHDSPKNSKTSNVDYENSYANKVAMDKSEALKKIYEHSRDFLSLEITLPLGNYNLKEVHTNQWLFTELPIEFDLANWTPIAEVLNSTYNRYEKYVKNSWYIENINISVVAGGKAEMKLKLNAFATNHNKYKENKRKIRQAFTDTLKNNYKQTNKNNSNAVVKNKVNNTIGKNCGSNWIKNWVTKVVGMETDPLKKAKLIDKEFKRVTHWSEYWDARKTRSGYSSYESAYNSHYLNCADGANILCAFHICAGLKSTIMHTSSHYIVRITINGTNYWTDCSAADGQLCNKPFNTVYGYKGGSDVGTRLSY